jgi:osmoprotectant transport system ATP-binding protein
VIRLERVSKTFARRGSAPVRALRDLDLEVRRGESLCLIGCSGCGKTTALRTINRLVVPDAGRITVDGVDVAQLDPIALRRRIGYVIQRGGLFPHLTIGDNAGLLCRLEGWSAERTRARVSELFERVQLDPSWTARYPCELSGGQRQRVGGAGARGRGPEVGLRDEPLGARGTITRTKLQQEFRALARELGTTVVLVSHDLDEAFRLGDRVALMADGELVQVGTLDEFRARPSTPWVAEFLEAKLGAG